jgi:hypothetical protein
VDSGSNRVSHGFNMTENSELSTPKTRTPFLGPSAVGALVRVLNRGPFHGGAMAWLPPTQGAGCASIKIQLLKSGPIMKGPGFPGPCRPHFARVC